MASLTTRRGSAAILLGAALISLQLAACGSSGSPTTPAAQTQPSSHSKAVAFSACMRSHGVSNFPDLSTGGQGGGMRIQSTPGSTSVNGVAVNGPAFRSAMKACQSLLPNGGHGAPLTASRRTAALQFSQCMRSHGLSNFPDPTFSGNGVQLLMSASSGIDPNSPAFKAAQRACGSILQKSLSQGSGPGR